MVFLRRLNSPVVRVCLAAHDNPRNRGILDVSRNVSPYCSQPSVPNVGFLGERARKHVPLKLAYLVTVRPAEFVATAADQLSRLSAGLQLDPGIGRKSLVIELSDTL